MFQILVKIQTFVEFYERVVIFPNIDESGNDKELFFQVYQSV